MPKGPAGGGPFLLHSAPWSGASTLAFGLIVETAGIEPASAAAYRKASTGLAGVLISSSGHHANKRLERPVLIEFPLEVRTSLAGKPVSEASYPPHGPRVDRLSKPRSYLGSEGELMVRTYWFFADFLRGHRHPRPATFRTDDCVEACRPLECCPSSVRGR